MSKRIRLLFFFILSGMGISCLSGQSEWNERIAAFSERQLPLNIPADLQPLIEKASDRKVVLLGECTHGTHEFYYWRDQISRELVQNHGFRFIALEGDWSALKPLDRYVRDLPDAPESAVAALRAINRWPEWMWNNETMIPLAEWLREWNLQRPAEERVGIHGMDVYGFWDSLQDLKALFADGAPNELERVRNHLQPLIQSNGDQRKYIESVIAGQSAEGGIRAVKAKIARLSEGREHDFFSWKQHVLILQAAEQHMRFQLRQGADSWNARASHFSTTVLRLLDLYGPDAKGIVWAHNTHIGDGRFAGFHGTGMTNIGIDLRAALSGDQTYHVGFTTGTGELMAATRWGVNPETYTLQPARPRSFEALMEEVGEGPRYLLFQTADLLDIRFAEMIPQRAIGVTFDPRRETVANYTSVILPGRFNAIVYLPVTRALVPNE